jgi:hypothetical protein
MAGLYNPGMRLWVVLGCVGLAAVGCKSAPTGSEQWVSYETAEASAPKDWNRFSSMGGGLTVYVPPTWILDDGTSAANQKVFDAVKVANPGASNLAMHKETPPAVFLSFVNLDSEDLKAGLLLHSSISVVKEEINLDFTKAKEELQQPLPDNRGTPLYAGEVKLPIGRALHFTLAQTLESVAANGSGKATEHIFVFGREKYVWEVTCLVPEGNKAAEELMMQMVQSIRVRQPDIEAMMKEKGQMMKSARAADEETQRPAKEEADRKSLQEFEESNARLRADEEAKRKAAEQQNQQQQAPPDTSGSTGSSNGDGSGGGGVSTGSGSGDNTGGQ